MLYIVVKIVDETTFQGPLNDRASEPADGGGAWAHAHW
jgi:hypothetical protein